MQGELSEMIWWSIWKQKKMVCTYLPQNFLQGRFLFKLIKLGDLIRIQFVTNIPEINPDNIQQHRHCTNRCNQPNDPVRYFEFNSWHKYIYSSALWLRCCTTHGNRFITPHYHWIRGPFCIFHLVVQSLSVDVQQFSCLWFIEIHFFNTSKKLYSASIDALRRSLDGLEEGL